VAQELSDRQALEDLLPRLKAMLFQVWQQALAVACWLPWQ
jgi:hypothetical protein